MNIKDRAGFFKNKINLAYVFKKDSGVSVKKIRFAALSPIMMQGALVLPEMSFGIIEASAIRKLVIPCTFNSGFTTLIRSVPILHVPTG